MQNITLKNHTIKRLFHVRNWIMHQNIQLEIHPLLNKKQEKENILDEKLGAELSCVRPEIATYLTT